MNQLINTNEYGQSFAVKNNHTSISINFCMRVFYYARSFYVSLPHCFYAEDISMRYFILYSFYSQRILAAAETMSGMMGKSLSTLCYGFSAQFKHYQQAEQKKNMDIKYATNYSISRRENSRAHVYIITKWTVFLCAHTQIQTHMHWFDGG